MKTALTLALSSCFGVVLLTTQPAHGADPTPTPDAAPPCGKLVGTNAAGGFALRSGEPVDFVTAGQATHGTLLVFSDGPVFRAYWQPEGSEEKYALANAGPDSVRLVSTPPQGTPTRGAQPGGTTQPMQVLSCPKF
ncbi:hypothetical protein [Paraburkholderia silvatlantica]|uniref:Uncharacterized protein n=1 Tax=Paraburkholderia silvatlantica TaxID=321895 RepID=A0A2U1ADF1_9BURK|nr:hypothetical protein [Paraburkholderia silvatlantica]MBB2926039.1 hypothetical protein [Paraburkholderia silvatlantica]PVY33571.1 hypothetical protein C7411_108225 [Paraburkholderia silvatlantica]PXW38511.1 hypothetical protein C7413_108225 [Paraburkholderia silvatlantica]PYE27680.1 hypothetical protein C7410_10111 [Paraburkholderia silvatlantica]TDQ92963.1 hypothetical protein C7412_110225 [Paraburkholderia silvatlantica]